MYMHIHVVNSSFKVDKSGQVNQPIITGGKSLCCILLWISLTKCPSAMKLRPNIWWSSSTWFMSNEQIHFRLLTCNTAERKKKDKHWRVLVDTKVIVIDWKILFRLIVYQLWEKEKKQFGGQHVVMHSANISWYPVSQAASDIKYSLFSTWRDRRITTENKIWHTISLCSVWPPLCIHNSTLVT